MADHQYEMAKTIVFWDREECKIPEGLEVGDVLKNIKMALEHIGYRGRVSIMATGDAKDDICSCKILMLNHFPIDGGNPITCKFSCAVSFTYLSCKFFLLKCAPFAASKTDVFWDMDDCPIPVGPDPDMIYQNITSALKDKGYLGEVSISTYGEIQIEFQSAGVYIHNLFIYITTTLSQNLILHKLLIPYACPKSQGKGFIS
ncbi:unnamed protein product [Brassica oleracea var. botrytis]